MKTIVFRGDPDSRFQSDLSSLILGPYRADGCLRPLHIVLRVYSTRLGYSQSNGTPRTNRGPFFNAFEHFSLKMRLYFVDLLISGEPLENLKSFEFRGSKYAPDRMKKN